jgi:hypothetical protein
LANRFVSVAISRQTKPIAQAGFGVPLILSFDKDFSYKEYTDITGIATDFGNTSNTYKLASAIFSQSPVVEKIAVYGTLATEGTTSMATITGKLDTLRLSQDDWYYLTCTGHADATIVALAAWNEANKKFYFTSTSNKALANTLNAERTVVMVHPTPAQFPGEAWVGVGAPRQLGAFTWTFKTLNGIDPSGYNQTDINTIETNRASTYIKEGGVNITSNGVTTSGEYIDIIQGQDYITSSMTSSIFGLLVNTDKIPYTVGGIAMIVAELEKALKDAADLGIIAKDADDNPLFTVETPDLNSILNTDKANRVLPNVNWSATIAGAVEDVDINGVLTL